jgi:Fic family protein
MKNLPEKPPTILLVPDVSFAVSRYFSDEPFRASVDEFNSRYLYWDELKYRISDDQERMETWVAMNVFRSQKLEQIPYAPLKLEYLILPDMLRSLHSFDRYLSGTIQIHNRSLTLDKRYIVSSLIEEAIASSILEGAVTTRRDAKVMLEQKIKPKNTGEQMVLNNYETLQMIIRKKGVSLTPELLLEIQQTVTKGTIKPEDVGHFRSTDDINVVDAVSGTVKHIPPTHDKIPSLISALCEFINNENEEEFIHPILKGIILHFLIGFIHPFNDGNGRTARSIFYWYTLSRGYWMIEYLSISRSILKSKRKYALAYLYTEYDHNDLTYFMRYQIECMNEALAELIAYLEEKQDNQTKVHEVIRTNHNLNHRQAEILMEMMDHQDQDFTIHQISEKFNIVYQTARTDLMHLESRGYITVTKRGKSFYYYATEKNRNKIVRMPEL